MNPLISGGRDDESAVVRVALASGVESITIHALVPSVMLCYDCHDGMASSHGQMMPIEQGDTIEVALISGSDGDGRALVRIVPWDGAQRDDDASSSHQLGSFRFQPRASCQVGLIKSGEASSEVLRQGEAALTATDDDYGDPQTTASFGLKDRRYPGELQVIATRGDGESCGSLMAINVLELETYLCGVLGCEMPLSWHDEALKAQAVAARTYTLHGIIHARRKSSCSSSRLFDMFSDTRSQVYGGISGATDDELALTERARAIVASTQGQVLMFRGEVLQAFYHSTCGGDTVPPSWAFSNSLNHLHQDSAADDEADAGALQGASDCKCGRSKYHRWTQEAELAGDAGEIPPIAAALAKLGLTTPLEEVATEHRPRGSHVRCLHLQDTHGNRAALSGTEARKVFGLRSPAFSVDLQQSGMRICFEGRGWGHGVGLCQWGAQGFASEGMGFQEILERAYPGAKLSRFDSCRGSQQPEQVSNTTNNSDEPSAQL